MNKYDHLNRPQAELDFHDRGVLTGAEVKRMTEDFVHNAHQRSLRRIRIITGKGRRSTGTPLVGPQVRRTLDALQHDGVVATYTEARITEGGAGALDVVLSIS